MMCIELLLNSANINLVAFSAYQPNVEWPGVLPCFPLRWQRLKQALGSQL